MKILSLFSGVGGFDLGLEAAGMETVFQCEWDKHATSVLKHRWPAVPKWGDISTLTGKHVLEHAPVIDVVAWGSPCQDLSIAGKRAGLSGAKSGLFHEGIRVIKEIQEETNGQYPRISIWENVVGALSSNKGADFGVIVDAMAEAGALAIEWAVLDAQHFGVPQRRRRVFVVAIFDPVLASRCPDPLLPVAKSLPGHLAKGKQKRQSAATTLTESTGTDGGIVNAIGANLYHKQTVVNQDVNAGHIVVEGYTPSSFANYTEGVGTLKANGGDLGGGSETLLIDATHEPILMRQREGKPGGGKGPLLSVDKSLTLASSNDETLFSSEPTLTVRRLTPLECERLMGWPDDHTRYKADGTEQSDTQRYKQCGNGVASPVAAWIGKHVMGI